MKKVLFFVIVIICLVIINNLIHAILTTWQKQTFVTQAEKELQTEETRNLELKQQLRQVSQTSFIEEQSRDKLLLVKPGEEMILIPSTFFSPKQESNTHKQGGKKPNWQQWLAYFFK